MKKFISIFLISLVFILGYVKCEKQCLLRGNCGDSNKNKTIPCAEENDPIEMKGEDLKLYQKLCPNLAKGNALACCDRKQLEDLEQDLELVSGNSVQSWCRKNYMELICNINCSPEQNRFAKVVKKSKSLTSKDKFFANVVSVSMDMYDAESIYRACKNDRNEKLNMNILTYFRDPKTPADLMYRIQNKVLPFEVEFHLVDNDDKAIRVVRDRETGGLKEEPVENAKLPMILSIED